MMQINFNTDKLVVFKYPYGAGGKFISLCLGIHPLVLSADKKISMIKMKHQVDENFGFKVAMKTFQHKKDQGRHFEYHFPTEMAGFTDDDLEADITADEKKCLDSWIELTNQNKFLFCMTEHRELTSSPFSRYPNRKTIQITNFEWVHRARRIEMQNLHTTANDNHFVFAMNSVQNEIPFKNEMRRLYDSLGLQFVSENYLETLRKEFIETMSLGFEKEEK
jgi:hypothetical protein